MVKEHRSYLQPSDEHSSQQVIEYMEFLNICEEHSLESAQKKVLDLRNS